MTTAAVAAYKSLHRLPFTKLVWGMANQIGVLEALLLEIIEDWCQNNAITGREKYYHDDEWWTAATYQEWSEMYPCLGNPRKLQRLLLNIEDKGYLISGQFLSGQWNQTKFYRPNPETIGELIMNASKTAVTSRNQIVPKMDDPENESIHSEDDRPSTQEMMEHPLGGPSSMNRSEIRSIHQINPPNPASGEKKEGGSKSGKREDGTNLRAIGNNPRAVGTNPRSIGNNPRAAKEKQFGFEIPEPEEETPSNTLSKDPQIEVIPLQAIETPGEDKNSAAAVITDKKVSESTKWRQDRRREVHPNLVYCEGETPWLNRNNEFKGEFVRWKAQEWMKKWTYSSVYDAEEAVISNFFNEPDKISLRWRTYSLTFNHHYESAAQRIASGGVVPDDEKEYLETNLEAVRSPMPQTGVSKSETLSGRDITKTPVLPQGVENHNEWKPKQITEEDQQHAAAGSKLIFQQIAELARKRTLPKAPPPSSPEAVLDRLKAALEDSVFRVDISVQTQAQKFIEENEEYCADYDEQGRIIAIYEF